MDKKYLLAQKILSRLDGGVADLWKIYKLMYFIDFEYYSLYKKSISGEKYHNWKYGPMPYKDSNNYAFNNIVEKGEQKDLWKKIDNQNVQINFENLVEDTFSAEEKLVIDSILDKYGKLSGSELVAISHEDIPWKMTKEGDEIDYEYVMWRDKETSNVEDITKEVFA